MTPISKPATFGEYPLKSMQDTEILQALQLFTRDIGGELPPRMIVDHDFKLIRGAVATYLEG
eukprot:8228586-Ditylum_brightwellii.AAC.1